MSSHRWYKNAVFYQVCVRSFMDSTGDGHGDLVGLREKLDYLVELGIDCIWIMPIYPSPLRDDGYDIADFRDVDSAYGSMHDLDDLIAAVHDRGLRLIMDLVVNHTSDQHPWFQAARRDRDSAYRDYYVWSDSDQKYGEARIIFLDVEPSNWTWDPVAGRFYWHRFYACQPDLNYDNPRVQEEMLDIARFWLGRGIDGFRVDAVPYLFEREGSTCENLPETHAFLKRLRAVVDTEFADRVLLCEANQLPEDVRAYFADGDEFHMGFHFPLMPQLFKAIGLGQAEPLRDILARTPSIPADCQWSTFLRNHDELTLEMVSPEDREWMWQHYAPDAGMRLNLGIRRRLAPLLDNDRRRLELIHSLLFTLPGAPILYYGDEIGMGDDLALPDRDGLRTPMQWSAGPNAGFSRASPAQLHSPIIADPVFGPARVNALDQARDPDSVWNSLRDLLRMRKSSAPLTSGTFEWLQAESPAVAAFARRTDAQTILAVHNLSDSPQTFAVPHTGEIRELRSARARVSGRGRRVELQSYGFAWLTLSTPPVGAP